MTTITRNSARLKSSIGRIAAIALMLVLSACTSGPPVQEMSDARQAIAVAREAGAAELAPDEFHAAEAYLASAQQKLSDKAYKQARSDAMQAKNMALDALANAERSPQPNPR
jgi:hypothetical protein